jgi:hypothetical protein
MTITFYLSGENTSPIPSVVKKEGRITENVAAAIKKLLKVSIKKPKLSLVIDKELIKEFTFSQGGNPLTKFKKLNFDAMKEILMSRYTAEALAYDHSTKDNEALKIAKTFGFKGTAVSAGDAIANIEGVEKGVNLRTKYQKEHAGKVAAKIAGPEIMQLEAIASENRKAIAIKKKADQLAITQAAEKLMLVQAKATKPKAKRKKKVVAEIVTTA